MQSSELKAEGMAWLRYVGKKFCVATEVGPYSADVLGIDEKSSVEIETKISKADLKVDFDKRKHTRYANADTFEAKRGVPNRFFFLVPKELGDFAVELVEARAPKYGVLTLDPYGWGQYGRRLVIKRKAQNLHKEKPPAHIVRAVTMRMSSELATLRYQLVGLLKKTPEDIGLQLAATDAAIMEFLKGEVAWDPEPLQLPPLSEEDKKILAELPPE